MNGLSMLCGGLLLGATVGVQAADQCDIAARYYALGSKANEEYRDRDALQFFEKAAAACNRYEYWQELGELAAGFNEPETNQTAADAFIAAYESAGSDTQEARSVAHYAVLLHHTGDPQRALGFVRKARQLDPDDPWISQWYERIRDRASDLRADDVVRGLGDIAFKPLQLKVDPTQPAAGGAGSSAAVAPAPAADRRVEIPLYFASNSTALDDATRTNVRVLADTLARDEFAAQRFVFIGHADTRGEAIVNQRLSLERAPSVASQVALLQPQLEGRIKVEGRGEAFPVAFGNTEADHRENRRLEVVARQ